LPSWADIAFLVRDPQRRPLIRQLCHQAAYLRANRVPVEFLVRLFPEIAEIRIPVDVYFDHHFSLPYGERTILAALVTHLQPAVVFEFGTFAGGTTRMMADLLPATSVVHTIDLPDDQMAWPVGGQEFRGRPEYVDRIVAHRGSTRDFDFGPFTSSVDLVFVDASHEFDDVMYDSMRALDIVNDEGLVVWDDYQPRTIGVVHALNRLAEERQLVRLAHSRLVLFRREPFPDVEPVHRETWVEHPPPTVPSRH
jgi:hypothetical protein